MGKKKIQPTDAMEEAGHEAGEIMRRAGRSFGSQCRWAIYAALNHPDAAGLFAGEDTADARPWEPLNKDTLLCRGDEVRRVVPGITTTAVVARVDEVDALWTAGGMFIGRLDSGTWYVRRAAQELPTEDGAVIVPAEGREFIGGDGGRLFARLTYSGQLRLWYGVVVNGGPAWAALWYGEAEKITPGTWKVDDQ